MLPEAHPPVDWVEGVAIIIAILIVIGHLLLLSVSLVTTITGYRWVSQRLEKRTPVRGTQSKER